MRIAVLVSLSFAVATLSGVVLAHGPFHREVIPRDPVERSMRILERSRPADDMVVQPVRQVEQSETSKPQKAPSAAPPKSIVPEKYLPNEKGDAEPGRRLVSTGTAKGKQNVSAGSRFMQQLGHVDAKGDCAEDSLACGSATVRFDAAKDRNAAKAEQREPTPQEKLKDEHVRAAIKAWLERKLNEI